MRAYFICLAILVIFSISGFASFPGYQMYNFGDASTLFDHNNNWAPISYPKIGHLPAPGYFSPGGELSDLEGLNVAFDKDYIHISLTNSFGYATPEGFRLGDLFIGVNGGYKYEYAVDMQDGGNNNGLWQVNNSWNEIQQGPDTYYSYDDIRIAVGAHEIGSQAYKLGSITSVWSNGNWEPNPFITGVDQTYVWELTIDKNLINGGNFSTISFHINLGCGNDLIEESFSAVPEPATFLLFGLGLLGAAIRSKKKK